MLRYPWVGKDSVSDISSRFLYLPYRHDGTSISFNGGKDCTFITSLELSRLRQPIYHDPGTVLLHLYAGALARRLASEQKSCSMKAIYIPVPSPFSDLEVFIDETATNYNMDLYSCRPSSKQVESVPTPASTPSLSSSNGNSHALQTRAVGSSKGGEGMRQALETYKDQFPEISAILIGTRRTDPHGSE